MIIAGIIAEYNPFHNGHLYQLQQIRKQLQPDYIVAIISGNYTQRGAAAITDKYARTAMALSAGVDLVLELPVYGALSSAEQFAESAVSLLHQTGAVTHLCFGAECPRLETLNAIAGVLSDEPEDYKSVLKTCLSQGISYPAARSRALSAVMPEISEIAHILAQSNNILAIEYLKACKKFNTSMQPHLILRSGAGYHDITAAGHIASASGIRYAYKLQQSLTDISDFMPDTSLHILSAQKQQTFPMYDDDFSAALACRLFDSSVNLTEYTDISADLANRITQYRNTYISFDSFAAALTCRNYTATRIRRALYHLLLGHTQAAMTAWKSADYHGYLRVLGFRKQCSAIFKAFSLPTDTLLMTDRLAAAQKNIGTAAADIFAADMHSASLYRMMAQIKYHQPLADEYTHKLLVL